MKVPFVDLKTQYLQHKEEFDQAIEKVLDSMHFIKGSEVKEFEQAFAHLSGLPHCIAVGNGTDAIYIALKSLDIGPEDEVITVANTWISTGETICQTGATPRFIDIEPDYYNIDPTKIEEKITTRTKAIIAVHLYGQPAALKEIKAICEKHNLFLIEDCAQAHLATYQGKPIGSFGDIATFSFFPSKNIGAFGDAGAILTQNSLLEEKMRRFASHGALKKHDHKFPGINSRMDTLQAAILLVKLRYAKQWREQRRWAAERYYTMLADLPNITLPKAREESEHVYHLFVIRTNERTLLQEHLKEQGIATGIHYPMPLPFLEAFNDQNNLPTDLPVAHLYKDQIVSLPIYPEITEEAIAYVCEKISSFFLQESSLMEEQRSYQDK